MIIVLMSIPYNRIFDGNRYLQSIPDGLFDNNYSITDFDCAFRSNESLKKVKIPITVSNLGSQTYSGCKNLEYIISESIVPQQIYSNNFDNTNNCPIYVPDTVVDAYKTATNWSTLSDRIKPMSDFATDFPEEVI